MAGYRDVWSCQQRPQDRQCGAARGRDVGACSSPLPLPVCGRDPPACLGLGTVCGLLNEGSREGRCVEPERSLLAHAETWGILVSTAAPGSVPMQGNGEEG